ncbi:bifunctional (p)ppGpp synthetase/guanosine-3',5'-bis(diphosphate) 3'-pyrophosphohydrolase [Candidatus Uhrbacteria bacterium]|nr:bifunctional (p)ppGpp synthetase/guanosine-3',5'-bis(diphosphate) 3'-pyrophosphohydrolase [Candidatus Uhrbacteria bacterium]
MTIEELEKAVREYNTAADIDLIRLAYDFAENAHRGQIRKTGEEYIKHPLRTAHYLANLKADQETIVASLLHEVPDMTDVSFEEIRKNFGEEVGTLVEGVSKLGNVKYRGVERYIENLRKMFVSIAQDVRIVLIKFAGRIHNLETLHVLPPDKQQRIAREVLEIYAPIADRLGIAYLRGELEDRAFPYIYPEEYKKLRAEIDPYLEQKEQYLATVASRLAAQLKEAHIPVQSISSRVKRLYSTYQKMIAHGLESIDGIYDIVAMRVIVSNIADCYAALGVIHHHWRPLPGRIKDYIAQPKLNHYRSLHTTVFCIDGHIVEFQIRTPEMQYEAEAGIAAHWHYTEAGKQSRRTAVKDLDWVQEILKLQGGGDGTDSDEEYLSALRLDIFRNRIFVFTPKGDVINLPEGATPVDFAYQIHSDVGKKCSGVKINDVMVPLDSSLKSGDVVEILIEKNRKRPSADWLKFVKTHLAKSHIKQQLRQE